MKKAFAVLLSLFLLLACAPTALAAEDKLVVYNWADYIYDIELTEFKAYYKQTTGREIDVTYVTFDTNETMLTKVLKGNAQVDVICPSEYAIQRLMESNALRKLNYFTDESFVNSDKINPDIVTKIRESFSDLEQDMTEYMAPYMWGTLGILYNADKIDSADAEAAGWGLLWNLQQNGTAVGALDKKISMMDSIRDSYCAVLLYMKERNLLPEAYASMSVQTLINTVDDTLLALAKETLISQKESLYGYEVDFGKNELIAGTAWVDLAWSGDALYAIEEAEAEGVNLQYFTPESGANIWFDGWVIPNNCQNEEAARLFIDFMNRPDIAMKNMMEIGYSSAVDAEALRQSEEAIAVLAEAYADDPEDEQEVAELAEAYLSNPVRYPNVNDDTLGVMRDFGVHNEQVVVMWESVRGSNISVVSILLVLAAVLVVLAAAFAVFTLTNKKKRRRVKAS